jgi:two-component system, cell cycle sensor histidine kinase and response regulator CckA
MTPRPCPAILIVADKLAVRRLIRIALAKAVLPTLEARTAKQGLQILGSHPDEIAVVITDLEMPHMGGLDLANEIGALRPAIKILYISGYAESVAAQSMAHTNPTAVLLKPFTGTQIVARVLELLSM